MQASRGIFVVAAKRTPFGAFGGKLQHMTSTDLLEVASKAALASGHVNPEIVGTVVAGNVAQTSADAPYVARHVGIRVGAPVSTPALTVNRLCGSGFQAIANGMQDILLGEADVALCGGTESMSQAPFILRGARFGTKLGQDLKLEDSLWATLTDMQIKTPMGITAENLGAKYGITREQCDEFALLSQSRWKQALDNGRFDEEMAPITVKGKKGPEELKVDEHPRPQTTAEQLAKLPPVFKKEGLVTAGNASGICDGAAAVVLASEEAVAQHKLTPLARLVAYHYAGCDPNIMGIGPVPAIQGVLRKGGKDIKDVGLFDVNEAFAAQFLAVQKELDLDPSITNVNGGAIALGHPVGASGARISANLVYEMRARGVQYGVGGACIGGGQGIALLFEKC